MILSQVEYETTIGAINNLDVSSSCKIALIDGFDNMVGRIYDDINKDIDLGAYFRKKRLEMNMSQHQAAYYLRMDEKTMAKYESGAMSITFKALCKFCRGFGISDDKFSEFATILRKREDAADENN